MKSSMLKRLAPAVLSLACFAVTARAQQGEIQSIKVQGNVYLLTGGGGNVIVQIGDQGVLVVDTGLAQTADKVLAAIRKLSDKPIQYILNTHFHPDHTGGNDTIRKAGHDLYRRQRDGQYQRCRRRSAGLRAR